MANQNAIRLIDEIWGSHNPQEEVTKLINSNIELKNNIQELKLLYNKFKTAYTLTQHVLKRSKLSNLLDNTGQKIIINEQTNIDMLTQDIFRAYHLTSEILQQLGLISEVKYTFTFIDDKGNFHRLGDAELHLEDIKLEKASRGRGYSLRLKESAIKARIEANTTNQANQIINRHFQKFSEPFYDYQNQSKSKWRVNKGILAETFERHWENLNHSLEKPEQMEDTESDLGTVGARWWLYKQSSGSDPYFTGPDTLFSQVKNANASLIDNINTVLNTTTAIIKIIEDANNINNIVEKIKTAFIASPQKQVIGQALWDNLEEVVQEQILIAASASTAQKRGKNYFLE